MRICKLFLRGGERMLLGSSDDFISVRVTVARLANDAHLRTRARQVE